MMTSCLVGVIFLISGNQEGYQFLMSPEEEPNLGSFDNGKNNILDGCRFVYLDVGTNIGVQIRKLFEPKLYPNASIHQVFDRYFGNLKERTNEGVCAVGFEPNPSHTFHLQGIEESYRSCDWRLKMYTETAVSDHYGTTEFFSDYEFKKYEWGGSILGPNVMKPIYRGMRDEIERRKNSSNNEKSKKDTNAISQRLVNLIRLSYFINNIVATRIIPTSTEKFTKEKVKPPTVIMKLDIEGSEVDVVADLLFSGSFKYLDVAMIEWHQEMMRDEDFRKRTIMLQDIVSRISHFEKLHSQTRPDKKQFKALSFDDETYYDSNFELPKCSKDVDGS